MSLGNMEQRTDEMKKQAQELIKQAYCRGFKAGQEDAFSVDSNKYREQGRNEAWEAVKKLYFPVEDGGLLGDDIRKIFGECYSWFNIVTTFSASEVVEKLRAYEEKKKEESEIRVGDEVRVGEEGRNAFSAVVHLVGDRGDCMVYQCVSANGLHYTCTSNDAIRKTGRHFPEITEVLKKLQEDE